MNIKSLLKKKPDSISTGFSFRVNTLKYVILIRRASIALLPDWGKNIFYDKVLNLPVSQVSQEDKEDNSLFALTLDCEA